MFDTIRELKKMLGHVILWLDAAQAHAQAKSFDPNVFVGLRLAPDQFPLSRQIQTACDTLKFACSRLTGKELPSFPDTEQTLDELKARVKATLELADKFTAQDFEGAATRVITNPRWEGKVMSGGDYFLEHAVPNFFFHVTHTYAILRHNGVSLGKRDYLGPMTMRDK